MAEVPEFFAARRNGVAADCSLAELGVKTGEPTLVTALAIPSRPKLRHMALAACGRDRIATRD